MRTLFLAALSSAAVLISVAAQAEDASPPAHRSPIEALSFGDPNRVVCLYLYHNGAVVRRAICRTARAWTTEYENGRQEIRNIQMLGLIQRNP
jgi:hypothetical protein